MVLHVSGSRRLILKTLVKIKVGTQVFNEDLRFVGKVVDVFGPVNNSYVAVEPLMGSMDLYIGRPLYLVEKRGKGS